MSEFGPSCTHPPADAVWASGGVGGVTTGAVAASAHHVVGGVVHGQVSGRATVEARLVFVSSCLAVLLPGTAVSPCRGGPAPAPLPSGDRLPALDAQPHACTRVAGTRTGGWVALL